MFIGITYIYNWHCIAVSLYIKQTQGFCSESLVISTIAKAGL